MQIYIMRHGQAELMARSDSDRDLTLVGRLESEKMASYLADNHIAFDAILVSPYVRAQQTFAAVKPFVGQDADVQTLDCLTPVGSVRQSINEILAQQAAGVKNLLIISHLPLVGYIVGELASAAGTPAFATSSVAHLELDESGFGYLHSLTSVAQIKKKPATLSTESHPY